MLISVERFTSDNDTTLSSVSVDGGFVCFGLEDEHREEKIAGETRIPAGRYHVALRRYGGFHTRYSRRFRGMHRGMLQVLSVPNFEHILIHVGNDDGDTAGCLCVGMGAMAEPGDMRLISSVRAYVRLYPMVVEAAQAEDLDIEYTDQDWTVSPTLA